MSDPDAAAADAGAADAAAPARRDPVSDAVAAALADLDDDGEEFEEPDDLTEEQRQRLIEQFGE